MKGLIAETGEFVDIGEAHPVAGLFPMLAGDDLEELIASIYEQGLLQPVVLDADGRVLDGRNRLAACERLNVIPEVIVYDGENPDGYAFAVNVDRRHLTKGQMAIVAARALLVSDNGNQDAMAKAIKVSQTRIAEANVILASAPDLADAVMIGTRRFDNALKEAREVKQARTGEAAQLAKLQAEAPDLAAHVVDEQDPMTLAQAMSAYRERKAERTRDIEAARSDAGSIVADLQARVVSIIIGARHGEPRLIDKAMVRQLRDAIDQLEELL